MANLEIPVRVKWLDWVTVEVDVANGVDVEVHYFYPWSHCEEVTHHGS